MIGPVRTLIVDDSAFARKVLRSVLTGDPAIEVVGFARDGLEALERISELDPDVVTLDLVMPNLDGLGVLRELKRLQGRARVVLVSISPEDSELVVEGLQLGAVGLVQKPTALATERLFELGGPLVKAVLAAGAARLPVLAAEPVVAELPSIPTSLELVAVGTSTGGPVALARLLQSLPANFPVPLAMALHIPAEYTQALAARLDGGCALSVSEAHDGQVLTPGMAVLAPGGQHLRVERHGFDRIARVGREPIDAPYAPSVDVLFASVARAFGRQALGIVMTGMGDDGLTGARAMHATGAKLLTQNEATSVVYGMPRCVREAGLSAAEAPLDALGAELMKWL